MSDYKHHPDCDIYNDPDDCTCAVAGVEKAERERDATHDELIAALKEIERLRGELHPMLAPKSSR